MKKLAAIFIITIAVQSHAQYPKVDIPGSEIRKITSSSVSGQEYELQILLPAGYAVSAKKYPVVYLMDSQWDFPLVKSIYGQQYFDGFIPELIVVGVTWGGVNPNPDSLRARDYTPTTESRLPQSGGADKFLSFMKTELFPFIESRYKADSKNRILMGCSLGGLLTLYTLFTHTDMFNGYVAASPAFGWDKEIIYQYEKNFYEKKSMLPARVYMTIGGVERSVPGFEKLVKFLADRNYSTVHIKSKVLENTGHSGTKSETYNRGLQYVFERPMLKMPDAVLNKYTGSYEGANGTKIELKNENNQLVIYFNPNYKYVLYAASESWFYSTNEFFNMHFTTDNGKVDGFGLDRYLNTQSFKKTN
ncbi:MAG: alpha/beta hydrolase-fold protein [Bacteroidota bacterium]|nr:alpha/beta hydrolase-fold protein [Bacteroidota bacterium]